MDVLVTGVTGRIGANVAAALTEQGHRVRGLVWPKDPRVAKLKPLGLELVEGSITNPRDCVAASDGMQAVYHLGAAFQGGGPFSERDYYEINVTGTLNMLEATRALDNLAHFVYAGTDAGISLHRDGTWECVFPPADSSSWDVSKLMQASDGSVWAARE